MVCNRCIMVVKAELERFGLHPASVILGEAEIMEAITEEDKSTLNEVFQKLGFSIIDDKKSRWIEKIKNLVIEQVYSEAKDSKAKLSEYISEKLHHDYSYLSKLFSEVEGMTVEKFLIIHRIERVKELLVYDELSLSQIAEQLDYSSVSHLSKQFKKVTGLTPTHFKQIRESKRSPIDEV